MGTTIISDAKTSMPRFKCDCFSSSALAQIRDVFNGDEPTYHNRGGVGYDIRELSDFALNQIRGAIGGRVYDIKSVWLYDYIGDILTEITPTTTVGDREDFIVDLTSASETKYEVLGCTDTEEPLDAEGAVKSNVAIAFDIELTNIKTLYMCLKNVGVYWCTVSYMTDTNTLDTSFLIFNEDNTTEKTLINILTSESSPKGAPTEDNDINDDNNDAPIDNGNDDDDDNGGGSSDK